MAHRRLDLPRPRSPLAVEPVPGLYDGPEGRDGPVVTVLEVDGERFAVRRAHDGGTSYDWLSGPNPGYGFGASTAPDAPEQDHRDSVRQFLSMIDPATGFIAED